jgi:hypothetical protein
MKRRSRSWSSAATLVALLGLAAMSGRPSAAAPAPRPFDLAVSEIETARGLRFLRTPHLESVAGREAFQAVVATVAERISGACPGPAFGMREVTTAFADPQADRVVATVDADALDLRVALAQLLDAQHYPELAKRAAHASGDRGIAERALLMASACAAAQGGLGPTPSGDGGDPFAEPVLEIDAPSPSDTALFRTPLLLTTEFLRRQTDREAPFRRPPRSTAELLIPGRWERGEGPVALVGAAPAITGCRVVRDESIGVFSLARAFLSRGGSVPRGAFVGWQGDRYVAFDCDEGDDPWVYVALFSRKRDAADFRGAAELLLPSELPRPLARRAEGRRVTAWHALDEARARAFSASLEAQTLR